MNRLTMTNLSSVLQVLFVIAVLATGSLNCYAQGDREAPAPETEWLIGFWEHGPDPIDITSAVRPATFVERLDARPECSATLIEKKGYSDVWHAAPKKVDAEKWVSVNLVVFKRRLNWITLQFDPSDDGVVAACWRPALASSDPRYSYINTIPPGPDSVFDLAQIELASEFARKVQSASASDRPLVKVKVTEVAKVAGDLFSMDEPIASSPMGSSPAQLKAVEVLAFAAASQSGLKPTMGDASNTLTVQVARTVDGMQVSVIAEIDGKKSETPTRSIHADSLYTSLRALITQAWRLGPGVLDVVQLDAWPVRPLLYHDHKLLVQSLGHADKHTLRMYNAENLMLAWEVLPPERRSPDYIGMVTPDGPMAISYTPAVERWQFQDGKPLTVGNWREANHPWGIAFYDEKTVVTANEQSIAIGDGVSRDSIFNEFKAKVDAGPLIVGEYAIAGASSGVLRSVRVSDGSTGWEAKLPGRLFGRIVQTGQLVLVASQRGRLFAINVSDGSLVWERNLGDALLGPPVVPNDGDSLVVVFGGTSLVRLNIKDGSQIGESVKHPIAAAYMAEIPANGGRVALVDMSGTVAFYQTSDLALLSKAELDIRPIAEPLYIGDAPHQWSGPTALAENGPMLLVPAGDGVCYLLDIPE